MLHRRLLSSIFPASIRFFACFLVVLGLWLTGPATALAATPGEESDPEMEEEGGSTAGLDIDILNKYVWRGIVLSDVPVAEPSLTVENDGMYINIWGNMDLRKRTHTPRDTTDNGVTDNTFQFNEIDMETGYGHDLGPFTLYGGLVHYIYPNSGYPDYTASVHADKTRKEGDTTEAILSAGLDVLLNPTISAYYDVDEAFGATYLVLDVSHTQDVGWERSEGIEFSAGVGWGSSEHNRYNFPKNTDVRGPNERNAGSGFTDLHVSVSFPIEFCTCVGGSWYVSPYLGFSSIIDTDLRHKHFQEDQGLIYGVTLSVPF